MCHSSNLSSSPAISRAQDAVYWSEEGKQREEETAAVRIKYLSTLKLQ